MHPVIGAVIKARADKLQRELSPAEVYDIFAETWLFTKSPLNVLDITERHVEGERGTDLPELSEALAPGSYRSDHCPSAHCGCR